ncbi:MAG: FtsK/SpoIIIE domain-containing protein [Microbacteriaceae bacterium]
MQTHQGQVPLALPERPAAVARASFPLIASLAPLLASAAIWVLTQSPFAVIFAVLSPVIAVAALLDSRWQARRRHTKDAAARVAALARLRSEIAVRHRAELRERQRSHPCAQSILAAAATDPERWRILPGRRTMISLGAGAAESTLALAGTASDEADLAICEAAAHLSDAPVVADAAAGVAIVGDLVLARALARGYLVQLVHRLPPTSTTLGTMPEIGWEWARALPYPGTAITGHGSTAGVLEDTVLLKVLEVTGRAHRQMLVGGPPFAAGTLVERTADRPRTVVTIALASRLEDIPVDCRTVIRIEGAGAAEIVTQPEPGPASTLRPELISAAQLTSYSRTIAAHARSAGLHPGDRQLPATVALAELLRESRAPEGPRRRTLSGPIGIGGTGIVEVDLVADGPHAVVGGTTGSGKSELLVTWVAGLAARYSPEEVTFLLVDFKGGAAFASLTALAHCVGVLTDLDQVQAQRAIESLRAELRHRERILASAAARDIADEAIAGALPRLVIVVDEFAAMIDAFPDLHALFVDIAARGRSLGVHLILCTQRPAGVVRDSLLANCNLRMSLRVNNKADSAAVVGSELAALLPAMPPGRCVVGTDGEGQCVVQIAHTGEDALRAIAVTASAGAGHEVRRPWLDPLPDRIPLASLIRPGQRSIRGSDHNASFVLGVQDLPAEQRQDLARYLPHTQGHLLAVGGHGAGKSTLAATLARQSHSSGRVACLAGESERAWDELMLIAAQVRSGITSEPGLLLVVDDIDALYDRFDLEHRQEVIDTLVVIVREGPSRGVHVAATAQRIAGPLSALAGMFGATLLLRLPNRQEYALAGGAPAGFQPDLPPGGGTWMGHRVQLALAWPEVPADPRPTGATAPAVVFQDGCCYLVVTRNPAARARSISKALTGRGRVIDLTEPGIGGTTGSCYGQLEVTGIDDEAGASVVIADADCWQSNYAVLQTLRPRSVLIFDGCSLQEVRTIAQRRELPPPLSPVLDRVWLLAPGGQFSRGTLP